MTSVHPQNDNRIFYKEVMTLFDRGYDISLIVAGVENQLINKVKIIGYKKSAGRLKRIFKTSLLDMIKVCRKVDADIYHFHDPELIFTGLYLKILGKTVVYDIHENNAASILSKPYIKSRFKKIFLSKVFDIFEKNSVRFFDAIVTARPDISKKFTHKNLITLRNFPILPNFETLEKVNIRKGKPSIIFVGNMTKIRGIYELLEAIKTLEQYELWLLGPIQEKDLEDKIKAGCRNVRYFGVVEAYDVFRYIQQADIGIITFLSVPNHINTLATKPFEYMACGKPMIMSSFPYWKETFQEGSFYVDPSNVKEIREKIISLFSDRKGMTAMGKLNQKLSKEHYNWTSESQKLIKLYEKLLYMPKI
jgi:glycosyltransferase involved in cell wall biosynthesis